MNRLAGVLKFVAALIGVLAAAAIFCWAIRRGDVLFAVLSGLAVLGGCVGGILVGLRWLKIRAPAGAEAEESKERPADPKARIAELRRTFHRGVKRFLSFGKDPYSVPWYLVVGETGAGKTEAIRHSSLGFPPGLQDETQGVGGTTSLDWWFTNQAVILDTAGEWILSEEDDEGTSGEWIELFGLLKSFRPGTPLNGMILTLPAGSLLKDTPEEIKAKAGRIARKLNQVQQLLEIRFPIFVMVAKCDLIVGFREFFDKVGAAEQQQMLGWANPAHIDEPYDPATLECHLEIVLGDLKRRRLEMLAAPPPVRDDSDSEADPVAALYSFPENLRRILPGLRAYLESIFLLGEWSSKPLFLRGIFFTSSMRAGSPVDVQVRDIFGVPAEGKPSGDDNRERAFFLHDMFSEKIFQEKGLVFSASSTKSYRRTRRALLWGFGLAGIALLGFLTWHSAYELKDEVGVEREFWEAAAEANHWTEAGDCRVWEPVLVQNAKGVQRLGYTGTRKIRVGEREFSTAGFLGELASRVEEPMALPWTFRFTAEIQGDLSRRRLESARSLFESSVLCPAYRAAMGMLAQQSAAHWNDKASAALVEVLRVEVQALATGKGAPAEKLVDLDALFAYILQNAPADYQRYVQSDARTFAEALQRLYGGRNAGAWPPPGLGSGTDKSRATVADGVEKFIRYWSAQMEPRSTSRYFSKISVMTESGEAFLEAEQLLAQLTRKTTLDAKLPATLLGHNRLAGEWERLFDVMRTASEEMQRSEKALDRGVLQKTYDDVATSALADAEKSFGRLRELLRPVTEAEAGARPAGSEQLRNMGLALKAGLEALQESLRDSPKEDRKTVRRRMGELDASLFIPVGGIFPGQTPVRAYEFRYAIYQLAYRELTARPTVPDVFDLDQVLGTTRHDLEAVREAIKKQGGLLMALPPMKDAVGASLLACDLAERWRTFIQIKAALDQVRDAQDGPETLVSRRAAMLEAETMPTISLTKTDGGDFDLRYSPAAAAELLAGRNAIDSALKGIRRDGSGLLEGEVLRGQAEGLRPKLGAFFSSYLQYWASVSEDGLKVSPQKDLLGRIAKIQPWEVNDGIGKLLAVSEKALTGFETAADPAIAARAAEMRRRAKAGRERVGSQLFANRCKDVIRNWTDAGASREGLRIAVLSMKPADFLQTYVVGGDVRESDLALGYWESLTCQALATLADEFQAQAAKSYSGINAFRRFPLGSIDAGALSAAETARAHEVFDRVRIDPNSLPAESLGRGGRTGNASLDALIMRMAVYEVPKGDRAWFDAADRVIAALPRGEAFECEITLLPADSQRTMTVEKGLIYGTGSVLPVWRAIALHQGTREETKAVKTEQSGELSLGKVLYPGDDLRLELSKFPDGKPDRTIKLDGPWAPLMALHAFNAERSGKDGREWTLGLTVKDDLGHDRKLWLKLSFSRALPELKDWPSGR